MATKKTKIKKWEKGKGDGSLFPFFGKRDTFKEKGKRETFNKITF